jgi:hypothetical protein
VIALPWVRLMPMESWMLFSIDCYGFYYLCSYVHCTPRVDLVWFVRLCRRLRHCCTFIDSVQTGPPHCFCLRFLSFLHATSLRCT